MLVLPSYVNQSIDLLYFANQLTGFDMRATLAFNGLNNHNFSIIFSTEWFLYEGNTGILG